MHLPRSFCPFIRYITNLPKDIDADLLYQVFSKYGIIQMDEFNKPRVFLCDLESDLL